MGDVDEDIRKHSTCITSATASVRFNVGPAATWVEFECTLNGFMSAAMPGGAASVGAIGDMNGQPVIGCTPRPVNVAGIGRRNVATTDKIKVCLQPGNHQVSADLSITAAAPPNFFVNRRTVANFEIAPVANPGLPHGLMLILLPKGVCPQKVGFDFGDIDGDGYFTATDANMLAAFLQQGPDSSVNPRLLMADIVEPCTGVPDEADSAKLFSILREGLESGEPIAVGSGCAETIPIPRLERIDR